MEKPKRPERNSYSAAPASGNEETKSLVPNFEHAVNAKAVAFETYDELVHELNLFYAAHEPDMEDKGKPARLAAWTCSPSGSVETLNDGLLAKFGFGLLGMTSALLGAPVADVAMNRSVGERPIRQFVATSTTVGPVGPCPCCCTSTSQTLLVSTQKVQSTIQTSNCFVKGLKKTAIPLASVAEMSTEHVSMCCASTDTVQIYSSVGTHLESSPGCFGGIVNSGSIVFEADNEEEMRRLISTLQLAIQMNTSGED
mmetsp:Transcript_27460/g.56285  ORF Transcript_27460/g.56285 Transcript_27460/m.56285 type:complete len:255 (-) Transcript_27460:32-796(-)|eukprot:CAMPEP_0181346110 /NCGR_PEP_ID=MMETSP1101-20121128/33141_1 /TAXON_ID=46948 /ORGANISM="Rhodomonas abbreviata, Strain Caron Lab Isolate" /LENGTH=254 /DNA_ID=CAMNT_0023458177 /DNA_START=42 /DNA_END=806 /DNA_ORIENTATION=+